MFAIFLLGLLSGVSEWQFDRVSGFKCFEIHHLTYLISSLANAWLLDLLSVWKGLVGARLMHSEYLGEHVLRDERALHFRLIVLHRFVLFFCFINIFQLSS